jgi:tRNA1(Val) A37 N6-methylase TrmN6
MPECAPHAAKGHPPSAGLFAARIRLRQPATGHRVGTDAALLAAAAPVEGVAYAVDLGAGVGAVGLAYAAANPAAHVRLVELDGEAARLARLNVEENGLADRVVVDERDALRPPRSVPPVDLVMTNPPWLRSGAAHTSPGRSLAHVMPQGGLGAWIKAALGLLAPRGRLVLIHRADALPDVLAEVRGRFGGVAVVPVLPREGDAAIRVLVLARKGSRGPFRLLAPLVLHGPGGAFTPRAEALHRGEARLSWD